MRHADVFVLGWECVGVVRTCVDVGTWVKESGVVVGGGGGTDGGWICVGGCVYVREGDAYEGGASDCGESGCEG